MDAQFNQLLEQLKQENSFSLTLTDGNSYQFSQLTTVQLKELIKTVIDSPLTQSAFNSSSTKVFEQSLIDAGEKTLKDFNAIDRLLFILQTRIQSISPEAKLTTKDEKKVSVNLQQVLQSLQQAVALNLSLFQDGSEIEGKVQVTFGVPSLILDAQMNEELYKDTNLQVENMEQLRKVIGEAFINEIAKAIKTITIDSSTIDFNTQNFKSRLKVVESLPAILTQKVIQYIEKYKEVIDKCLTVQEDLILNVDGSLFSSR